MHKLYMVHAQALRSQCLSTMVGRTISTGHQHSLNIGMIKKKDLDEGCTHNKDILVPNKFFVFGSLLVRYSVPMKVTFI